MVFQNEGLLKVWIWCLAKANHETVFVPITTGRGSTVVEVGPGQFIFGRKTAAQELSMNESTLYKRMQILKKHKNVTMQSNTHYSIVSIINWQPYQERKEKSNRQGIDQVTTKEQPSNTNNNDNNENNKKHKAVFSVPDFIKAQTWTDFELMRKQIKKPMTDRARKIIVGKLEKMKTCGHDVESILEKSITNCWQDVYEPKDGVKDRGGYQKTQQQPDYSEFD